MKASQETVKAKKLKLTEEVKVDAGEGKGKGRVKEGTFSSLRVSGSSWQGINLKTGEKMELEESDLEGHQILWSVDP